MPSACTDPVTLRLNVGGETTDMSDLAYVTDERIWNLAVNVDLAADKLELTYETVSSCSSSSPFFDCKVYLDITSTSDPPPKPPSAPMAKVEEFITMRNTNCSDADHECDVDAPLTHSFRAKHAFFVVRCDWALTLEVTVHGEYANVVGSDGSMYKSHKIVPATFSVPCHAGSAVSLWAYHGVYNDDSYEPMAEVHWSCDVCENPGTDPVTEKPLNTDECATDPCGLAQTCTDPDTSKDGDFVCTCDSDKDRSAVGERAVCGVSECLASSWPCSSGQMCRDDDEFVTGDFECYCLADVT